MKQRKRFFPQFFLGADFILMWTEKTHTQLSALEYYLRVCVCVCVCVCLVLSCLLWAWGAELIWKFTRGWIHSSKHCVTSTFDKLEIVFSWPVAFCLCAEKVSLWLGVKNVDFSTKNDFNASTCNHLCCTGVYFFSSHLSHSLSLSLSLSLSFVQFL